MRHSSRRSGRLAQAAARCQAALTRRVQVSWAVDQRCGGAGARAWSSGPS